MTRQILNTLFVQTQGAYLRLDHETLCVEVEGEKRFQVPLHHLGGLVLFGNVLISPFLLHRCARDGRDVVWFTSYGAFQGRLAGPVSGNVLLRRAQNEALNHTQRTLCLSSRFVQGKIKNTQQVLQRATRENQSIANTLLQAIETMKWARTELQHATDLDSIRGIEGQAASVYFQVFPALIRSKDFSFEGRNKRPPRDPTNALLSFVYTLVKNDCVSALEGVGLDPQIGYLHTLRPGRPALALDLMEEFRSWWADRLVLSLINRRQIKGYHFEMHSGGAVYLNETGRREVLTAYQKRKQETVKHRLFKESIPIGLLPYTQARILARYLRQDLDQYQPFYAR
ncbi:MAG: type I-C CRISPR-associated endonuclease Cas1c [Rhodothermales bacterium]